MRNLSQRPSIWLIGAIGLLSTCLAVQAETPLSIKTEARSITTKAASVQLLRTHARFNSACAVIEPPRISVEAPPAHGIVCLLRRSFVVRTLVEDASKSASHCLGREINGFAVVYLARSDYAGADTVRYSARYRTVILSVDVSISVLPADIRSPMPPDISEPDANTIQAPGPIPWCTALVS